MRFFLFLAGLLLVSSQNIPRTNLFSIEDFGGVGDGVTLNTNAFRNAIEAIKEAGEGLLRIPAGKWLTGPFNMTSHMTLFLDADATILGSTDMSQFQIIAPLPSYGQGRDHPGPRYEALIGSDGEEDLIITGNNGTIDGQGKVWWDLHNSGDEVFTRGHLLEFMSSKDITVEKVTLQNSPFWTVHPWNCENLLFRELIIFAPHDAPNTDGIDPDSCVNVRIEDSIFSQGDDGVAIKSGWDCFGTEFNKPTRNVFIRNLTVTTFGHGGVSIGSEMSGGVENVFVTDCHFMGSGMRIKTNPTRGGFIRNVFWSNIIIEDAEKNFGIEIATDYGDPNPSCPGTVDAPVEMENFFYNNITGNRITKGLRFFGMSNDIVEAVFLNDVSIETLDVDFDCQFVHGTFNNLSPDPRDDCPQLLDIDVEGLDSGASAEATSMFSGVVIGLVIGIGFMILMIGIWIWCSKARAKKAQRETGRDPNKRYLELDANM